VYNLSVMKKIFKNLRVLYRVIPAWLRGFFLIILAGIIDHSVFNDSVIHFLFFTVTPSFLHKSWSVSIPILVIIVLFILIFFGSKSDTSDKENLDEARVNGPTEPIKLKKLSTVANLGTYTVGNLIWDVMIKFDFDVNLKPRPREFAQRIFVSELPVCKNCGSGLIKLLSAGGSKYKCATNNVDCKFNGL